MLIILILLFTQGILSRHIGELVCRECGATITRQSELKNLTAADPKHVKYSYDFPISGKSVHVDVLENPKGEKFHVFGSKTAVLKYHGQAMSDATWFPGMKWTICVCRECGRHMGWYFEPETSSGTEVEDTKNSFVGLVLERLISADYIDTLTKTPDFK